jgi:hypothetical protein
MSFARTASILACSVSALVLACSGDDGGASNVSPEQACDSASRALCDKFEACAPFYVDLEHGDVAKCRSRILVNCSTSFTAPGTSATPNQLSACATAIGSTSCDDVLRRKLPSSCVSQPGALADGAACGHDAQCKGRLCRKTGDATCGACSTLGAAGAACEDDEQCDQGLVCENEKCVKPREAGESCGDTEPCARTLSCAGGTCAVPLSAGAACKATSLEQNDCDGTKGLYCDVPTKTCATIGIANPGQSCGLVDGKPVLCVGDATCKLAGAGFQGTCQAPAADGAACNEQDGPHCQEPASCVSGICTITDPSTCK